MKITESQLKRIIREVAGETAQTRKDTERLFFEAVEELKSESFDARPRLVDWEIYDRVVENAARQGVEISVGHLRMMLRHRR